MKILIDEKEINDYIKVFMKDQMDTVINQFIHEKINPTVGTKPVFTVLDDGSVQVNLSTTEVDTIPPKPIKRTTKRKPKVVEVEQVTETDETPEPVPFEDLPDDESTEESNEDSLAGLFESAPKESDDFLKAAPSTGKSNSLFSDLKSS